MSDLPVEQPPQGELDSSANPAATTPASISSNTKSSSKVQAADDDRFECRACGYKYNPAKGDPKNKIIAGTPFTVLPTTWKCPSCGVGKKLFTNIGTTETAGFKENQGYGLVNTMTQGQKSLLIYGALAMGILLLLSFYSLN
jgi:rubredoxin